MEVVEVKDYNEMSQRACSILLNTIKQIESPVLGLATGSTPLQLYNYLIEAYRNQEISFQNVSTFNLDEYVGINKFDHNSYRYYMDENLFKHIDILPDNINIPKGNAVELEKECLEYEEKIRSAGHVNVQILGLGLNGHIGFNEPGSSFQSRTHIVDLAESTRRANARFFDSINEVPSKAITMGIGTIMESKKILLLVSGEKKATALAKLLNDEVSEDFPASVLKQHENVLVIADEAACKSVREKHGNGS
jgi:glucosamine-6-phosphate deaminase